MSGPADPGRLWTIAAGLAAALSITAEAAPPPLDPTAIIAERFGNDAAWYAGNIPVFDSSDAALNKVYYYRWSLFRAHQRDLGTKGYITTEFLDDVGWQREPYASLNDATGFHLYEGRWLRDRRYVDDYIAFLYDDGGNDRHFSEAIADAVWARYLVDGDRAAVTRHLSAMRHVYGLWDDHLDFAKGLYWIEPLLDATEYTIASIDASGGKDGFAGGHAFRPSINSYMVANARAIGHIATLAGDLAVSADYAARAERLRQRVLADLWSPTLGHFVDRYRIDNAFVRYWQPIRGRELVGYLPWTFGLVVDGDRAGAWRRLLDPAGFGGAAGFRTVEPAYEHYMRQYRYDALTVQPECQWNGPVWPFQTTQVLAGLANLLRGGPQDAIGRGDYLRLLRQYAALHVTDGRLDLQEDYHPETGRPIVGLARSHHYFHSGFNDLVISGLAGIVPQPDDRLVVDSLLPEGRDAADRLRWFALQGVPYKGHDVAVMWDEDGTHYRRGAGLVVWIDGVEMARRATNGRIEVPVTPRHNPRIAQPIDLAVQLVRGAYPRGSASSGNDPEALHDAIDGRTWFFPEVVNGWTSAAVGREAWYAVDLGPTQRLGSASLSFAAGADVVVPGTARVQAWTGGGWRTVKTAGPLLPIANGVTELKFAPIDTSAVRVVMAKPAGAAVRLVELKLFAPD